VAKRESKIQIETKKNHELFISNQAITDFKLANVRTAVSALNNKKPFPTNTACMSAFAG
jgi:hypothetical protein